MVYRKTHMREYVEELQREQEKIARRAKKKALKAESERLAREAEAQRRQRKLDKQLHRLDSAREDYDSQWKQLLASRPESPLHFSDIPWPVLSDTEELSAESISAFLFPPIPDTSSLTAEQRQIRKDKLREAFLRFHPDKFEGRLMPTIVPADQDKVREALTQVVRALNCLLAANK